MIDWNSKIGLFNSNLEYITSRQTETDKSNFQKKSTKGAKLQCINRAKLSKTLLKILTSVNGKGIRMSAKLQKSQKKRRSGKLKVFR